MHEIGNLCDIADRLRGKKHLVFHASVNESANIGQQLIDNVDLWPGLSVETFMPGAPCNYLGDPRISVSTVMPGGHLRQAVNDGKVRVIRESLFQQAQAYACGQRRADIVVLQVSPADQSGQVSLGPSVGIVPQVLAQNPFVIAIINRHVPRTNYGIAMEKFDAVMELDELLPELAVSVSDDTDLQIADNVLSCLGDDITVEVGMSGTPDAIMRSLSRLRGLRIHTGLINDTIMDVVEAGALAAPVTTTMAVGSSRFYQWMDDNPALEFKPITQTHHPDKLAKIPRFHAINAALQVDLHGNVNAERIGQRIISCPGGLPDFAIGAQRSQGGCNIIVLRSTAGRAGKSTIVNELDHTTISGSLVDIIVTENGIADLRDLKTTDRAAAIRWIAHPTAEFQRN